MPEFIGYNKNNKLGRLSKETEERYVSAQHRLMLGQQYRQKQREAEWDKSYDTYTGESFHGNPEDPTADVVNVNVSFSTINTLVPFVADEDPEFVVHPFSGDASAENAELLQSFLNRLWKSTDVRGQQGIADATFDYLLYGDGYVKIEYAINMMPIRDERGNPVQNQVKIAEFDVSRVNPWDIWIDPFSDGIHNARWLCQRLIMPIEELKADDRYKMPKGDVFEGGDVDSDHLSPEDRMRLNDVDTENWVTVYEFYDLKQKWMMSFVWGMDSPLRYIEYMKCPIVQLPNYRIPNSPYHIGELEQISSLQDELNKTRSQMITHRRRNVAKWAIAEERLTDEAKEAMRSGRTNDIIPLTGPDMPLENLVSYIAPAPLSADSYQMDAQIRADINEITGVNEYLRGVPQNISRTATEASIIEGATNIRTRHKLLQVERCARDVGQILLDVVRDVLPLTRYEEMTMYVTGREAQRLNRATGNELLDTDVVLEPIPEIFQGRYEVTVSRGSTELRDPATKAEKLQQIVGLMLNAAPLLMQLQIPFNLQRLLEMWLEAEGIPDVDALFEADDSQTMLMQIDMMRQMNEAQGAVAAQGQGGQAGVAAGGRTPPGEPRPQAAQPPADNPNPQNSGMLPGRSY